MDRERKRERDRQEKREKEKEREREREREKERERERERIYVCVSQESERDACMHARTNNIFYGPDLEHGIDDILNGTLGWQLQDTALKTFGQVHHSRKLGEKGCPMSTTHESELL